MAHVTMTTARAKQLGILPGTTPRAPRRPTRRQRPDDFPPDVDNGHTWQRDGRGFQCQQCPMWLPLWAMSEWAHGEWEAALQNRPVSDENAPRRHDRGQKGRGTKGTENAVKKTRQLETHQK